MKDLSVVIVSYNTKDITLTCIAKLVKALSLSKITSEIIVIDNNSQDRSSEALRELHNTNVIQLIQNKDNPGFGKANNQGLLLCKGRYVLYLNSDVYVPELPFFDYLIQKMDASARIGAMTVRVNLPNESIDPASHRGFPTVWRSFCYYARLEHITRAVPLFNTLFGGYHLTHLSLDTIHEIDTPTGAFFLARKTILDTLKGFDEDYFMYGEDIDLAFRIKRLGYGIVYDPTYTVIHLKNQSGIKKKNNLVIRKKTNTHFYDSMIIFYKKHYEKQYPKWISQLVYAAIQYKKHSV